MYDPFRAQMKPNIPVACPSFAASRNTRASFLAAWWIILSISLTSTLGQKNLFECPHGIVDGADGRGKCLICSGGRVGNAKDDQECQEAKSVLVSHRLSPWKGNAKAVAEMDCGPAKTFAKTYGWKSREDLRREAEDARQREDSNSAERISNQTERTRKNSPLRQFEAKSWKDQGEIALTSEPDALNKDADDLEEKARKLDDQASKVRRNGDNATALALENAAGELRSQARIARSLSARANTEQQIERNRVKPKGDQQTQELPRRQVPAPFEPPRSEHHTGNAPRLSSGPSSNSEASPNAPNRLRPPAVGTEDPDSSNADQEAEVAPLSHSRRKVLAEILGEVKVKELKDAAPTAPGLERFDGLQRFDGLLTEDSKPREFHFFIGPGTDGSSIGKLVPSLGRFDSEEDYSRDSGMSPQSLLGAGRNFYGVFKDFANSMVGPDDKVIIHVTAAGKNGELQTWRGETFEFGANFVAGEPPGVIHTVRWRSDVRQPSSPSLLPLANDEGRCATQAPKITRLLREPFRCTLLAKSKIDGSLSWTETFPRTR